MTHSFNNALAVLQAQPFSRLLQAELLQFDDKGVALRIPVTAALAQQFGFVHGGVLSYAADNALTFAGGLALGPSIVTSEFKINYLRPAKGEALIARANVVHAGKTQAVCRCEVYALADGEEKLCAIAQGTIAQLAAPG